MAALNRPFGAHPPPPLHPPTPVLWPEADWLLVITGQVLPQVHNPVSLLVHQNVGGVKPQRSKKGCQQVIRSNRLLKTKPGNKSEKMSTSTEINKLFINNNNWQL